MNGLLENNLQTMDKLAEGLKTRGVEYGAFDFVIYQLIEEGLLEAEAGNFGRAVWNGDEIAECDDCQELSAELTYNTEAGLVFCPTCTDQNEEGN
jgi:hypothetical protein